MSKRQRPSGPSGPVLRTRRPIEVGGAELSVGLAERVVVTIRGDSDSRKNFRKWAAKFLVSVVPCQWLLSHEPDADPWSDSPNAFDVAGPMAALDAVCGHQSVLAVERALAVRVGVVASGSGPEKVRSSGPPRKFVQPAREPMPSPDERVWCYEWSAVVEVYA